MATTLKEKVPTKVDRATMSDDSTPRLLGVAFLLVIVTSLVSGLLIAVGVGSGSSVVGTASVSHMLHDTAKNLTIVRIGVVEKNGQGTRVGPTGPLRISCLR